jgi:indoleacetamide hydrolase
MPASCWIARRKPCRYVRCTPDATAHSHDARYFADNALDAMLFPTTILAAVTIDAVNGSSTISIDGGPPAGTFNTFIRNTDPGSNAGIPGLSIPAGLTASGLPVGLEIDGPLGSDDRLIGIGLSIEAILGALPAPPL